jgi:hypothetical protein
MNGMIDALGLWFNQHLKGHDAEQRMREAYSTFAAIAIDASRMDHPARNTWPKGKPLPEFDNNPKVIKSISRGILRSMRGLTFADGLIFLGQLWGKWLLVCPKEILIDILRPSASSPSPMSEEDLICQMLRYIDIYGNT